MRKVPFPHDFTSVWPDMIRGISILCVMIENWFTLLPARSEGHALLSIFVNLFQTICGTFVHMFFIISGYGLVVSYIDSGDFIWSSWFSRRFRKIVIPFWAIITASFFLANLGHSFFPQQFTSHFSCLSLLSYATFTQGFYPPGWDFNRSFWFMPVIIGLYLMFPLLLWLFKRFGTRTFILLALLITYGSTLLFWGCGYRISHDRALPFFFVYPFALGMAIAYILRERPNVLEKMSDFRALAIGIAFYFSSWAMIHYWGEGKNFNKALTETGLLFICLPACRLMFHSFSGKATVALIHLSKLSYSMYLLHAAFILYLFKPILKAVLPSELSLPFGTGLLVFYIMFTVMAAMILEQPMRSLSSFTFSRQLAAK